MLISQASLMLNTGRSVIIINQTFAFTKIVSSTLKPNSKTVLNLKFWPFVVKNTSVRHLKS